MRIFGNIQGNDTDLIYAGLGRISGKGRETLKRLAQSLVLAQNNPGYSAPKAIGEYLKQERGTAGARGGEQAPVEVN